MKLFDRRFKYSTLNHSGAQVRRRRLSMFYLAVVARRLGGGGGATFHGTIGTLWGGRVHSSEWLHA